ncbi:MAG: ATP synthase F1 subunit gamma [Thermodesulfobacterium sp.]|nr:ATP synthase F1 subunit gamma [Thermodesulfobacterium sp.]
MPALRDIRRKIEAVKRIGQITKAMNMVASAKLRTLQERLEGFRPYRKKFEEVIDNVLGAGTINTQKIPFLQQREVKKAGIILVTADKGLCGAFNSNLIRETEKAIRRFHKEGKEVELTCVGKKGVTYFQRRAKVREAYPNIMGKILMQDARKIARSAMMAYLEGEWDEVYVIYGYFINVVRQIPKMERIIPLSFEKSSEAEEKKVSYAYIYEPEEEELLSEILPLYINTLVFSAMLETSVSEQAARMTAMDNANKACGDMVKQLTLFYNKVRQASITKELMDIVGGAEAIKG